MKCDKCGYSDNGSGDWAHACGPVAIQQAPVANERIRLLAELADKAIRETDLREVNGGIHITPAFEKFAELIVKECIDKIETHRIPVGNSAAGEMACEWTYAALKEIRDEIREHFGVDE